MQPKGTRGADELFKPALIVLIIVVCRKTAIPEIEANVHPILCVRPIGLSWQGIPFTPPCHRRWDAAEGLKMQSAKKRNLPPNCKPLEMKTSWIWPFSTFFLSKVPFKMGGCGFYDLKTVAGLWLCLGRQFHVWVKSYGNVKLGFGNGLILKMCVYLARDT